MNGFIKVAEEESDVELVGVLSARASKHRLTVNETLPPFSLKPLRC